MDTGPTFVADSEPAKAMQPREGPLDHPSGLAEAAAVGCAALGQLRSNTPRQQLITMWLRIIAAVSLDEPRPTHGAPDASGDRRHGIDQREQLSDVVPIGGRQRRDERNPVRVGENMMLRPGFAAIGRVRSSFFPPRNARSEALSTTALARSSWPRRRSSVSSARCSRFQTPARCQRTRRRQQVVPEPHPISRGSMFHGTPLRRTNRIPVRTARSGMGFRPAYCRRRERRFGRSGSMRAQSSSSTRVMRDRLAVGHATVPTLGPEYKRVVS
jgi:hypothetical protein